MVDFNEVAEYARRDGERHRDIIALGEKLKEIGSIDLAAKERQEALDKVNADLDAANAALATTKTDHEAFLANREKDLETHRAAASEITDAANRKAADIAAKAKVAADGVIAAANTEVARIQSAHAETMAAANSELQAARTQLAAVTREIEVKRAESDSVAQGIEQMKTLARAALG